jgi:hypothetical protein
MVIDGGVELGVSFSGLQKPPILLLLDVSLFFYRLFGKFSVGYPIEVNLFGGIKTLWH